MSSENKKKKLKNSYCCKGMLKNKTLKLKRVAFYTSALRKKIKSSKEKLRKEQIDLLQDS